MLIYENNKLKIYSWCDDVEEKALNQAYNLANHPAAFHHIALMPDCHMGYGMPIGGVAAFENVVIPNAVGVDIGCGMCYSSTDFDVENTSKDKIDEIRDRLYEKIPVGFNIHSEQRSKSWDGFTNFDFDTPPGWYTTEIWDRALRSMGTLGGGNHFIEIQKDQDNKLGLMLHSGSRNIGAKIAEYYNNLAAELNAKWYSGSTEDLAILPVDTKEGRDYIRDMTFALQFAEANRFRMMTEFKIIVLDVLGKGLSFGKMINIHHNYAAKEYHFGKGVWVHRKGATSARSGEFGIIPGSMGNDSRSYIVTGRGNRASFMSCSHGAGRKMGRNDANKTLSLEECNKSMEGISFRGWGKDRKGRIDLAEASGAYKDIYEVINNQLDLVDIYDVLKPIGVVKG